MNEREAPPSTPAAASVGAAMVTVVKASGIPWFEALEQGMKRAARDFSIEARMIGPAKVDAAAQAALIDRLVAEEVDAIGLVPLDVKVTAPALQRARAAGIVVITHEGPTQEGRDWDVELVDSDRFGEMLMQSLAKEMGEQGEYVVYVGTPTTPLHNRWADAAIAYQRARYPKMTLAAERFPGADDTEAIHRITRDVIAAYPAVRGILGMSANGPIGAGWAVRERGLQRTIAVVGTVLPSQAAALIKDGAIRCGYLWSPADAGYAITALAKLALDGVEMEDGMEIPGLGKARVDPGNRRISVDRMIAVDRDNVAELAAQGL